MCDETDSKSKNSVNLILQYGQMTVLTSKGNVPNTYKELIRRIMIFEYGELQLLKSSKNKVASDLVINGEKRKTS